MIVPSAYVYKNLICEFDHYDMCLTGLIELNGKRWFCRVCDTDEENVEYEIGRVAWTPECEEYLRDYRQAYLHWFHDENPRKPYGGWPLDWFKEKWQGRNPIEEQSQLTPRPPSDRV